MEYLKYKVVDAQSLCYREKPTLKGKVVGYLHEGDKVTIVKDWSKKVDDITWFKLKSNDKYFYVSSKYLKRITPNYLARVSKYSDDVYAQIIALGCKHQYGVTNYDGLKKKRIVTCGVAVSIVLQLSGMLEEGKLINHTDAANNPLKKKVTLPQTVTGINNLDKSTFTVQRVAKDFASLPAKFKKKGAIYIYNSNMAIYAGNNAIYSCNNAESEMRDGKYIKDKVTNGYCFTNPIIYVIMPND